MLYSSDACRQRLSNESRPHYKDTACWRVSKVCTRGRSRPQIMMMLLPVVGARLVSRNGPVCGLAFCMSRASEVRSKNNHQYPTSPSAWSNKADSVQVGQAVRSRPRSRAKLVHSSSRNQSFWFDFLIRTSSNSERRSLQYWVTLPSMPTWLTCLTPPAH
jgi:hypothetical protein